MPQIQTPAILLRSFPFSETSRTLRFYSERLGSVSVMARGVRKSASTQGGNLVTFSEGMLTIFHRENRDLQTFKEFSAARVRPELASHPTRLAGASVLGELVLAHAGQEENPTLYEALSSALDVLAREESGALLPRILAEVWRLVSELGYRPSLDSCVDCGTPLGREELGRFDFSAGGIRCPGCESGATGPRLGPVAREQLGALLRGCPPSTLRRPRAHLRLASDFITYHISGGSPLRSVEVLAALLGNADA